MRVDPGGCASTPRGKTPCTYSSIVRRSAPTGAATHTAHAPRGQVPSPRCEAAAPPGGDPCGTRHRKQDSTQMQEGMHAKHANGPRSRTVPHGGYRATEPGGAAPVRQPLAYSRVWRPSACICVKPCLLRCTLPPEPCTCTRPGAGRSHRCHRRGSRTGTGRTLVALSRTAPRSRSRRQTAQRLGANGFSPHDKNPMYQFSPASSPTATRSMVPRSPASLLLELALTPYPYDIPSPQPRRLPPGQPYPTEDHSAPGPGHATQDQAMAP